MPIQDSDSDGSDASLPSDSCTVSSEVQRAARSELARQMKHSKELQTALEASQKEMEQLQGRISKLETIAHAAPQDIGSSSVVAPDRPLCAAPCHTRAVATATMATATTATAMKSVNSVRSPEVDDDVARMPPMLPRRTKISRDKISEVLANLQDLAKALAYSQGAKPSSALHDGKWVPLELVGVHLWFFRVARCTYTCIAVAVAVSELCVHQWQRLQMCHTILLHRSQSLPGCQHL